MHDSISHSPLLHLSVCVGFNEKSIFIVFAAAVIVTSSLDLNLNVAKFRPYNCQPFTRCMTNS